MNAQRERRPGGTGAAFGSAGRKTNDDEYTEALHALQAVQQVAREYIQTAWAVVPIPLGKKAPQVRGWQNLRISEVDVPKHFNRVSNIGVILGGPSAGLVDVDLDCQEAIGLAPQLLPKTNAIFGRAGKPRSHWLYYIDGPAPTIKLKDPLSGKMLVELRGDGGHQTVFPPSIHESGEPIRWEMDGDPAIVNYAALSKAIKTLAAACLIQRYLPEVADYESIPAALSTVDPRIARCLRDWLQIKSALEIRDELSISVNRCRRIYRKASAPEWPIHSPRLWGLPSQHSGASRLRRRARNCANCVTTLPIKAETVGGLV
jgi:hypothetical protein